MEDNTSINWCTVDSQCKNLPSVPGNLQPHGLVPVIDGNGTIRNISSSNNSCSYPFCVVALYYTITNSNVRIYDIILLAMSALFLFFLLVYFIPTIRKLHGSLPLFKILYAMVFVIPVISCINEILSISLGYYNTSAKVLHVILRGDILMTELSVVVFGLFFKYYDNQYCKLVLTLAVIIGISVVFTIAETLMELFYKRDIACSSFQFFTHGGMLFLFSTSTLFAIVYLTIFMLYLLGFHHRWGLPSKKSFYRYALFLSLVNLVQAIGSMLWYNAGTHHPHLGNAGICLTILTTVIYVGTFAPVVYWIFLKNYFRMNKPAKGRGQINTSVKDSSLNRRPFRQSSRPILTKKRPFFEDQTSLTAGSFSSTSSYGSLNDEEAFTRQLES